MEGARWLATVLFMDIVGSTERARQLGDRRWRELLEEHRRFVRRELQRFQGREVSTAGDGFLAAFNRPTQAIRCAWAVREAARALGLEVRAGVHMGEVERMGRDMGGIAVHIGARVAEKARPGELLVSRTAHDAVEGSEFQFEDRGAQTLKGVAGEWQLFAVAAVPEERLAGSASRLSRMHLGRGMLAGAAVFLLLFILAGLYVGFLRDESSTGAGGARRSDAGRVDREADAGQPPGRSAAGPAAPTQSQLTFVGDVRAAAISPDGKSIAYIRGIDDRQSLYVQDVTGGQALELLKSRLLLGVEWAPNGSELLVGGLDERLIVPRLGGSPRRVAGGADWSPDGSRLVGAPPRARALVFTTISTNDTTWLPLTGDFAGVGEVEWSPAGDRIAFITEDGKALWTVRTDGEEQQQLVTDTLDLVSVRWSPSGNALYYLRDDGQTRDLVKLPLSRTGRPAGNSRTLMTGLETARTTFGQTGFSISGDGKTLLYPRGVEYANSWLVTVGSAGKIETPRQITSGTAKKWPSEISPDGQTLAIAIGNYRRTNIFLLSLRDGSMRQLTFLRGRNDGAAWSPDGKTIAFSSNHDGSGKIWLIPASGGTPRAIEGTETRFFLDVAWAPSPRILYPRGERGELVAVDPESGHHFPVTSDSLRVLLSRVSADGTQVAAFGISGSRRGLWVIPIKGGSPRLLYEGELTAPLAWSRDGRWIWAWNYPGTEILTVPATGGKPEVVATLPFDKTILWVSMAPDEKRFVCNIYEAQSDVWIAENFDPAID